MRTLKANQRLIFYALKTGSSVNEFGEETLIYTDPIPYRATVQIGSTGASIAPAGIDTYCDAKIITADMDLPWDEFTVFWVKAQPVEGYDFVMSAMPRETVNGMSYRLRRRGDL